MERKIIRTTSDSSSWNQQLADYAMAFDLVSKMAKVTTEDKVIEQTFVLFSMLCAPSKLVYLQFIDGNPKNIFVSPAQSVESEPIKNSLVFDLKEAPWVESEDGFILRIHLEDTTLGILGVEGIPFVQFKKHYLNLGINLVSVIALAISNARHYEGLEETKENLEFANKELESFIYSVSHDLRAPLRHISGYADLLDKHIAGKLDEKGKRYLSLIHDGSEKMSRIIDDLLNISRITKQQIRRTEVNVSAMVASIIKELREIQPNRSLEVDIKEGLTAFADRGLIEIALSNLLGNAWKFTSQTKPAYIEFGTIEEDGKVVYYVRDNGAGFNQQFAKRMFWPFHRLHSASAFEGTGIGLAIVDRIIRCHGGKVWAEGIEGKGATIYFSLT